MVDEVDKKVGEDNLGSHHTNNVTTRKEPRSSNGYVEQLISIYWLPFLGKDIFSLYSPITKEIIRDPLTRRQIKKFVTIEFQVDEEQQVHEI